MSRGLSLIGTSSFACWKKNVLAKVKFDGAKLGIIRARYDLHCPGCLSGYCRM